MYAYIIIIIIATNHWCLWCTLKHNNYYTCMRLITNLFSPTRRPSMKSGFSILPMCIFPSNFNSPASDEWIFLILFKSSSNSLYLHLQHLTQIINNRQQLMITFWTKNMTYPQIWPQVYRRCISLFAWLHHRLDLTPDIWGLSPANVPLNCCLLK